MKNKLVIIIPGARVNHTKYKFVANFCHFFTHMFRFYPTGFDGALIWKDFFDKRNIDNIIFEYKRKPWPWCIRKAGKDLIRKVEEFQDREIILLGISLGADIARRVKEKKNIKTIITKPVCRHFNPDLLVYSEYDLYSKFAKNLFWGTKSIKCDGGLEIPNTGHHDFGPNKKIGDKTLGDLVEENI